MTSDHPQDPSTNAQTTSPDVQSDDGTDAVAIVAMSCRFPGAADPETFFEALLAGRESLVPESRWHDPRPEPVPASERGQGRAAGILHDIDALDAAYFGLTPREAALMDPQQRLFMECAAEALQSAGLDGTARRTHRIGVYAGMGINTYFLRHVLPNPQAMSGPLAFQAVASNEKDFIATQTSYRLGLDGPSISIHSACSTSLVAVATAFDALLAHQCDAAIAGASSIKPDPSFGFFLEEGGIGSPDGVCRTFDAAANGTVGGSGVGVVVLRRLGDALADGDPIHAVIRGAAVNNDGAAKSGYTAPSVEGQVRVIEEAMAVAGIRADTIGYIEAHGTGTPVGDPIEVQALTRVFRADTDAVGTCALGAVKTNVGHLDAAAGMAGLIKTALVLQRGMVPPTLHFRTPNPALHLDQSPFFVNSTPIPFPHRAGPRRAGVSSFGIGGTNAHLVLEEPPAQTEPPPRSAADPRPQILPISARSPAALRALRDQLSDRVSREDPAAPRLRDVAWVLQNGRRRLPHRAVVVAASHDEAVSRLRAEGPTEGVHELVTDARQRDVVFLLPGQGAQHVGMGRHLYANEPTYRAAFDACADRFQERSGIDLREILFPPADAEENATARLADTLITQPALFAVEYALAQTWMSWGIQPAACIGHSLGEYVAACLAGVLDLDDAVDLVAARARIMHEAPPGAMLSVMLPADEALRLVPGALEVAALNAPGTCVLGGTEEEVEEAARHLSEQGVHAVRLHVTRAFHSRLMDGVLDAFRNVVEKIRLHPPRIPYVSNVTGDWIRAEEATDPAYWVRHVRQTVRFAEGLDRILDRGDAVLLEVGPGRTLGALATPRAGPLPVLSSLPHPKDRTARDDLAMRETLARLWLCGVDIDWPAVHAPHRPRRVPLPTYPWERQRHWLPIPEGATPGVSPQAMPSVPTATPPSSAPAATPMTTLKAVASAPYTAHRRPALPTPHVAPRSPLEETLVTAWEEVFGFEGIGVQDDFFALGGHSLLATRLVTRLRETFDVDVALPRLFEVRTVEELAPVVEDLLVAKVAAMTDEEAEQALR